MRHLISINDLARDEILAILDDAEKRSHGGIQPDLAFTAILAFLESSLRTRVSFSAAVARLGGTAIDFFGPKYGPGMSLSESLPDAIRCASGQTDILVLRHCDADLHAIAVASSVCPVINAGNGRKEHPTQALLDLFAIRRCLGRFEKVRIGIVGDPESRSAHSLLSALAKFDAGPIRLIHPPSRPWSSEWTRLFAEGTLACTTDMKIDDLDVLYMAGLPEGSPHGSLSDEGRKAYRLTACRMEVLSPDAIVLCPLPRIDEIDSAVDADRRCRYFEQADGGQYVRQSVLAMALRWKGESA